MVGLAVMCCLIVVEAVSRKLFSYSTMVTDEMSGYLMVFVSYLGMGYALREGSHIQVKLVVDRLSQRFRSWLTLVWHVVGLGFVILLTFRTLELTLKSYTLHSLSIGQFPIPLWPVQGVMVLGLGLLAFQLIAGLIELIRS